jgi:Xaa-Pro dipeptidase
LKIVKSKQIKAELVATIGLMSLGILQNGKLSELIDNRACLAFFPHGLGHYVGLEVHDVGATSNHLFIQNSPGDSKTFSELSGRTPNNDNASMYPRFMTPKGLLQAPATSILEENMVVTVEPGIYFNRYAIEEVWLKNEKIGKYINEDLLDKYYPVGGVRIEDDILITKDGYENLTTTPKGQEALDIINGGCGEVEEGVWIEKVEERRGWLW